MNIDIDIIVSLKFLITYISMWEFLFGEICYCIIWNNYVRWFKIFKFILEVFSEYIQIFRDD